MKSLRDRVMRHFAVAIALYQTAASTAFADVVVLRDGTKVHGKVANREQVRLATKSVAQIVLIADTAAPPSQAEVILIGIVQEVLLEDGDKTNVIDFSDRPAPPPGVVTRALAPDLAPGGGTRAPEPKDQSEAHAVSTSGIVMAGVGFAAVVIGVVAMKEDTTPCHAFTGAGCNDVDNTGSALLILVGGTLTVAGLIMVVTSSAMQHSRPLQVYSHDRTLGLAYHIRY